MKELTCALTGHRILPPDFDRTVLENRLITLIKGGCSCFLCGMAEGFDLLALECLVALKEKYKITLEACIPYEGQEKSFSSESKRRYEELLPQCDRKTVILPSYRSGCFLTRNRYMVDCADIVLAYITRMSGGTAYTVRYAEKKGVLVIVL